MAGMPRGQAILGTAFFLVIAPGTVAVLVPWLVSGWHVLPAPPWAAPLRILGVVLVAAGTPLLLDAFRRFVVEGLGTPAPVAPPVRLVVRGPYRYVRNPMYVGIEAIVLGQALALWSGGLVALTAAVWLAFDVWVRFYEEPVLRRAFGREFETYCAEVPRWVPRFRKVRRSG